MDYLIKLLLATVLSFAFCAESAAQVESPAESESAVQQDMDFQLKSMSPSRNEWPQWMGADHRGVSVESGWSVDWPDSGVAEVWSHDIGIGFSSMSISDGHLFTMGNAEGTESVYCFDANDGTEIWRHSYSCKLVAVLYEGGPGSTPTIESDRVYAVGKEGQLMCLNASNGDVVWEKRLQEDLDVRLPEWGFNASPLILGDLVILEVGRLVAYDKHSGKKVWQSEKHNAGYGSVRAIVQKDRTLLASLDCDGLRINDASNGSEIVLEPWGSPFRTNSTTPIVDGDSIFVSTGYNVGCGLFRIRGDELEEVYVNREMRNHFNNSILLDGYLYGFDGNSNLGRVVHLKCIDHATGEVKWKHRGLGCGSLMIADKKLILLSDDGRLVIARANAEGFQPLAESQILEGRCWTVPVLLNKKVYARNAKGTLVCVQLPKTASTLTE